jgi:hypothetical protein
MPRILRQASDGDILMFFCPGCEHGHQVTVNGKRNEVGATWTFNGNMEKPTFTPSLLIPGQCHSFVTDGRIQFLGDSKHKLANQTVDIPDWDAI